MFVHSGFQEVSLVNKSQTDCTILQHTHTGRYVYIFIHTCTYMKMYCLGFFFYEKALKIQGWIKK